MFCREVKREPARVKPLKVGIDWERWRIPKNGGPPLSQSIQKMEETRSEIEQMLELNLIEPSNCRTTVQSCALSTLTDRRT
jgi:hypothetical protein